MKQIWSYAALCCLFFSACSGPKVVVLPNPEVEYRQLDTLAVVATAITPGSEDISFEPEVYNSSFERTHDLLHTSLDVRFDWDKQYVYGKAILTLSPYFYPSDKLTLDAKGFDVHSVQLISDSEKKDLKFKYDGEQIEISLGRTFQRDEEYSLYIDYTAKPNERTIGGSSAITSDKGLYFINPRGEDGDKPMQIWTQGETESSSAWFPTIDKPNERCTQEIKITVQDRFQTLSNGLLTSSTKNADGTRTDYYVLEKPHAPYLFMLAIGEFAVVKEEWNGIPLEYYVEKEYEPYAKEIYTYTPEMLSFFSEKLGVTYPWPKYSQIIVRDYVSGAMENTTGVIYGDFIQKTDRELIDNTNEGIVAHEMFHHWFGNLVTCESWSNLALNESFANYSEYLWEEHKHGKEAADYLRMNEISGYLSSSRGGVHDLIWFDYDDKEDMFDAHSYNKGGAILHMLRSYIGDDAFFASFNKYLTDNAYSDVESHEFRLAVEEVTGQDWNWFFNQWFFDKGHPVIDVKTEWSEADKKLSVSVNQTQNPELMRPVFEFPVSIETHNGKEGAVHKFRVNEREEVFEIDLQEKPVWVNFDANKHLLGVINYLNKEEAAYILQYKEGKTFKDRNEAISFLTRSESEAAQKILAGALSDPFWYLRYMAIDGLSKPDMKAIAKLASGDPDSRVRGIALELIGIKGSAADVPLLQKAIKTEKPYRCIGAALSSLVMLDKEAALKSAEGLTEETNGSIVMALGDVFVESGDTKYLDYFEKMDKHVGGFSVVSYYGLYMDLALAGTQKDLDRTEAFFMKRATNYSGTGFVRYAAVKSIHDLKKHYTKLGEDSKDKDAEKWKAKSEELQQTIRDLVEKEPSSTIRRFMSGFTS